MKYVKLTIAILLSNALSAQELNCDWIHSCGDDYDEYSSDAECDNDGNFIVSGAFGGQLALDYFDSTYYLENSGSRKAFLAKYSPSHELLWSTQFGGANDTFVKQIRILHDNSILICGKYVGECDFLPGPEEYIIQPYGYSDAFFAHYSSDGVLLWAIGLGGPNGQDWGTSINSDTEGNIYISGYFNYYADIDPGPEEFLVYNPLGASWDMFIAKLNQSGEFVWGGSVNGPGIEVATDLAFDEQGNLVVSGLYEFQPDFDLFETEWIADAIPNGTNENAYIAKYTTDGSLISVKAWGDEYYDSVTWMSKNEEGYLIAGIFSSGNDLDPGIEVMQWPYEGAEDIYVAQLDNELNFLWVYAIGGENEDNIQDLDIDTYGNIAVAGDFEDEVDFDPGPEEFILIDPIIDNGLVHKTMLIVLDKNGQFKEAQQIIGVWNNRSNGVGINDDQIMLWGAFQDYAFSASCIVETNDQLLTHEDIYMFEFQSPYLSIKEEYEINAQLSIFPNPSDNHFTLSIDRKLKSSSSKLELKTTDGKIVFKTQLSSAKTEYNIPTSELADGVYLLVLEGENFRTVQRVVVMH